IPLSLLYSLSLPTPALSEQLDILPTQLTSTYNNFHKKLNIQEITVLQ
ncbi:30641_t:CDS:1, partial [Racocetra persica]